MLAVFFAGFATRSFGMFLRRMFGKGGCLPLGRSLGGFQADLETCHLRLEFSDDFLQFGNASITLQATRASGQVSHTANL
jgi:hypothetical protein